jgi:hypothetical protein
MPYEVQQISTDETESLYARYRDRKFFSAKADISGVCVKLYSEDRDAIDMWQDNFYAMSPGVRSHARIVCVKEEGQSLKVLYDRLTSTAFLINFDYYGWVKSIALAMASDILEDAHKVYSVHGAALDIDGVGVTLIAPSKTGKTTQSWGLLRAPNAHLITDDWYFVRLTSGRPMVSGSEKNCYIDADIGDVWEEYRPLVNSTKFDNKGRGIANVRWVTGSDSVILQTYMRYVLMLKRDPADPVKVHEMSSAEALEYLVANDFCNPHQMVRDDRKRKLRTEFFREYLSKCRCFMVNTTSPATETQQHIREAIFGGEQVSAARSPSKSQ